MTAVGIRNPFEGRNAGTSASLSYSDEGREQISGGQPTGAARTPAISALACTLPGPLADAESTIVEACKAVIQRQAELDTSAATPVTLS